MSGEGEQQPGKQTADPLWDTRRRRLDAALVFTGIYLVLGLFAIKDVAMLNAMVSYSTPAFGFAGLILGAYFGVAEWGRINGVLGTTVEATKTEHTALGVPKTTVTTTTISGPMPENIRPPKDI